jgi:hypothetical protein
VKYRGTPVSRKRWAREEGSWRPGRTDLGRSGIGGAIVPMGGGGEAAGCPRRRDEVMASCAEDEIGDGGRGKVWRASLDGGVLFDPDHLTRSSVGY